ncbi:uncharacterized protein PV06_04770 [Exophiala oligosperma]|uniref:Cytochrome P450 oxidoreductase n=1 Tax=Exophiala oligosperma TaxID=215243 RepID=A0A0D2E789_9EURO|nr:uncharacterized protein PV06_04770 [Exophiala oligosperma]KIW43694.1 hypothetical protein PV06_04770 [Exophiala oligosperma]
MITTNILALGLLGVSITFVVVSFLRSAFTEGLRDIPGPLGSRFLGIQRVRMTRSGDAPRHHRALHEKYGSVVRIAPGHVSISDPAMVPVIYGINSKFTKSMFYSLSDAYFDGRRMETIFSTRSAEWHRFLRGRVSQLYSMSNLRGYEPYADECTAIFTRAMYELQGQRIDFSEWLQWYAFDVIACITFQRRFGFMEEKKDIGGMIEAIGAAFPYMATVGQLPFLHPWLRGNKKLMSLLKKMRPNTPNPMADILKITEDEIARYDRQLYDKESTRTDFLAQLRAKEEKTGRMPHADLVMHLSSNLLAGSDTTAIVLRACFYYLLKNPRCYTKLVAEIDEADASGRLSRFVSHEESLRLRYFQAALKEVMRLHPGVALILERIVPEGGMSVNNYYIPAGTNVGVNPAVIHHDKTIYGVDADDFRPERWLEAGEDQIKAMDRNLLTFGHGSRTCVGKNISLMEMGKFVPQILRYFDVEWASDKSEWTAKAEWLWRQSDVFVRVYPRKGKEQFR